MYNLSLWRRPDVQVRDEAGRYSHEETLFLLPLQELLKDYANDGGIYRHRWSDQSTFPFVLATFKAKVLYFGGVT